MKKVTLLLAILYSFHLFSQEELKDKKFTFTPFAQYGTSYRTIKGTNLDIETPSPTYGYGIRVSYNLNKLAITSGIEYQQFGEKIEYTPTFGDQIDPQTGFIGTGGANVVLKYRYNYFAIPIILERNNTISLGSKFKMNFSLFAGVKANVFYKSSLKAKSSELGGESTSKSDYNFDNRTLCLSSTYGLLFHKRLGSHVSLKIGPTFDLFHQSISNSTIVERIPYKASFLVGLSF